MEARKPVGAKKNITVTMSEELRARVRVWAAKHGKSTSLMIAELVEQKLQEEDTYHASMKKALSISGARLRKVSTEKFPSRDELHDR